MNVLMLSWEFPPNIAGGLGMACYGLAKALSALGVKIKLILPTSYDAYFKIDLPQDADILPAVVLEKDPLAKEIFSVQTIKNLMERLRILGITAFPESYLTPGFKIDEIFEVLSEKKIITESAIFEKIRENIKGNEPLFKKIHEYTIRATKIYKNIDFDVIHAHDWLTYPAGISLKNMTGKKLICHIHATEFDRCGGPGDQRIHNIEYSGFKLADQIIAVSQYTAKTIVDRYMIDPNKIKVVYNAFSLGEGVIARRKSIFKTPLILFMGRITIQKGPDYFIEIAERILKKYQNVKFVMAGTGDMFRNMLKRSASKRLKENFLFAGFLNREQVEKILSATDIFVMPSVSEPFGIVPLEAMAHGAVVIMSKQSGVSELVKDVFKVDFWDVDKTVDIITELLENRDLLSVMAIKGQKEALSIGWQRAAEETDTIYRNLICSI